MKASIKPVLLKHKKLSSGKYPVFLRVTIDRKIKYFKIGADFNCRESEWSKREGYFKPTVKDATQMNEYIDETVQKARKIAMKLEKSNPNYSVVDFSLAYTRKGNSVLILSFFKDVINKLENTGHAGNADVYSDTRNRFEAFLKTKDINTDITFERIDAEFLDEWIEYLSKSCSNNTIFLRLRTLRALNKKAMKQEGLDYYIFKNYSFYHLKTNTLKRALSIDEIKAIFNYSADPRRRKYHSLNYFKFMYLCRGMNFTDLCRLEKTQLNKNNFDYDRKKNGVNYSIPLFKEIQNIINEYAKITEDSIYVFPILSEKYKTEREKKERIDNKLKRVNSDLKEIANELNIDKKVTTYVSRHTFATVLKYLGESTELISEQLGHAKLETTQIYLNSFTEETLKDSTEKAIRAAVS